jgi:xanthosine utilization system XapX-like protein
MGVIEGAVAVVAGLGVAVGIVYALVKKYAPRS